MQKRWETLATFNTRRRVVPALAALVAGLVAATLYWPAMSFGFLSWDDQLHLLNNPFIQADSPDRFAHFWREPYGKLYVPITYNAWALLLTLGADADGRPSAGVMHAANLVVHSANTVLVLFLLKWATPPQTVGPALLGALLFAVHPLQVESVAWVSEFRGLLAAALGLLAMLAYVHSTRAEGKSTRWVCNGAGVFLLALALLCKPSVAAVPLMLLALDALLLRRGRWRAVTASIAPWLLLSGGALIAMRLLQPQSQGAESLPLWTRPLIAADAVAMYLRLLVWPANLCADYSRTPQTVRTSAWFWIAWIIPMLPACLFIWKRWWGGLACSAIFVAALAPVLGLVPFEFQRISTVADRYAYLALVGPALLLTLLLQRAGSASLYGAAIIALLVLFVLSGAQLQTWRDDQSLWAHAMHANDRAVVATANLAEASGRAGRRAEAELLFDRVMELAPRRSNGYSGRANLAASAGELERAERWYWQAIAADPGDPLPLSDLGALLAQHGRFAQAEQLLRRSIEIDPAQADAWVNLGALLLDTGRPDSAIAAFESAIRLHPRHPGAWTGMWRARLMLEGSAAAGRVERDAAHLAARDPEPLRLLARAALRSGDGQGAVRLAAAALARWPDHAATLNDLGQAFALQGRADEAITAFERAVQLRPDLQVIKDNLRSAQRLKELLVRRRASVAAPASQSSPR